MDLTTTSITVLISGETYGRYDNLAIVTIEDGRSSTRAWMNFMIVRSLSLYNGIIKRHRIQEIQVVPSTAHGMLKFLADKGIVTICSTILIHTECAMMVTSSKDNQIVQMDAIRERMDEIMLTPEEKLGYIRMVAIRHDRRGQAPKRAKAIQAELADDANDFQRTLTKAWTAGLNHPLGNLTRKLNLSAITPLSVSWTLTKVITRYIWQSRMKRKQLFTPANGPEGIKLCPDKTKAVLQLPSPRTIKEVQSLNGTLPKAKQAFKQLKQHLLELPLLVAPKLKEELIVYMSATHGAISAVLITERGTVQTPVYFQCFGGRLQKWSVMLGEHNITYRLQTSVKGQILADFLIEKPDKSPPDTPVVEIPQGPWTLFMDRSSWHNTNKPGGNEIYLRVKVSVYRF
ncbi:hypothetical protein Tco_0727826 [Tanacetum coccineum]|uniref:Reverse transcriptase domain-containing protein n=1 Tax=Tanacetum coccineum TaxID=301880 RepID=A0ABQ4YKD0_9ASTR